MLRKVSMIKSPQEVLSAALDTMEKDLRRLCMTGLANRDAKFYIQELILDYNKIRKLVNKWEFEDEQS